MKKIVIIGATGEVGMYITDYFCENLKEKYEIIAVGKRKTNFFDRYGIKYFSVDIRESENLEVLPKENIYAVICLAALMPAKMEGYEPAKYIEVNTYGVLNVLEYCRRVNADRILFTQTIRDLGNKIGKEKIEADALRDFSYKGDHAVYVISKNAAVDLIEHYYQEYGLKRFIFRLPTIYMYTPNEYYCVNGQKRLMAYRSMIEQAIVGDTIEVWGDPTKAHDIVYVKDLAKIFGLACECGSKDGGIYNVGTGCPISLLEQVKGMIRVFGTDRKGSAIKFCPEKTNAREYEIDISKTCKELGYKPSYSYIEYLEDLKEEMFKDRFKELFIKENENFV